MLIKKILTTLVFVLLSMITLSGCASKPVPPKVIIQEKVEYVGVDANLFKSCPKPKKISALFKHLQSGEVTEKEIADAISRLTLDHIACYKTLLNIRDYDQKMRTQMNSLNTGAGNETK